VYGSSPYSELPYSALAEDEEEADPTTASPGLGALVVAGLAPTVLTPVAVATAVGVLTLTGVAPTVLTPVSVTIGLGALDLTGFLPTVGGGAGTSVSPALGELALAGLAPTALTPVVALPAVGVLSLTGFLPTVTASGSAGDYTTHPNLISAYFFEDASSPSLDHTANNNDLTWSGSAAQDTTEFVEGIASLSTPTSSDQAFLSYASLSANFPFKAATTAFTVVGRVYVPAGFSGGPGAWLGDAFSRGFQVFAVFTGQFRARVFSAGGDVDIIQDNPASFAGAGWHWFALRWNGDNVSGAGANDEVSFWIDGVKQGTTATRTSVALATTGDSLVLRGATTIFLRYDEWAVFDAALLDTDLAAIYADGLAGGASVSAVLTGTGVGGITEQDVVAGGKTFVITLSGDEWIA
jgi:hypothetical protein